MKKILLTVSIFSLLLLGSCSSDDNSGMFGDAKKTELPDDNSNGNGNGGEDNGGDKDEEEEETNLLMGKWIPSSVKVSAMGNELANLPYPHREECDKDYLEIKKIDASFTYHGDTCKIESQTEKWSQDKDLLKINLLGTDIEAIIIENTATSLIISGNGQQFESLIPIFLPDANIPPFLLATAVIELTLNK